LTIVFAALAVSHWIEHQTSWGIKKFVRTVRRYRTVQIPDMKDGRAISDKPTHAPTDPSVDSYADKRCASDDEAAQTVTRDEAIAGVPPTPMARETARR